MKRAFLVLFCFMMCSLTKSYGQSVCGQPNCLGELAQVFTIDLTNDPIYNMRYYKLTIPVPSEGLILPFYEDTIEGPGCPYLTNFMGNTVDMYVNRLMLLPEFNDDGTGHCQLVYNLMVSHEELDFSIPFNERVYYHYHIIVNVKR